jgi:hypothetical protein
MSIISITTPDWLQQMQMNQNGIPQQMTVIPRQQFMKQNQGPGPTDTIPAKLTPGEMVVPRTAVQAAGGPQGVQQALNQKTAPRGISLTNAHTVDQEAPPPARGFDYGSVNTVAAPVAGYARGTVQPQQVTRGQYQYPTAPGTDPAQEIARRMGIVQLPPVMPQVPQAPQGRERGFAGGTIYDKSGNVISKGDSSGRAGVLVSGSLPTNSTTQTSTTTGTGTGTGTIYDPAGNVLQQGSPSGRAGVLVSGSLPGTTPAATTTTPTSANPYIYNPSAQAPSLVPHAPAIPNISQSTLAPISPAIRGVVNPQANAYQQALNSPLYQAPRNQIRADLGASAQAQNIGLEQQLAQQGVQAGSGAARAGLASQAADQETAAGKALASYNQQAMQSIHDDMATQMQAAIDAGDYASANQLIANSGGKPIDFTNMENQRRNGQLTQAANDMLTTAATLLSSSDPATRALGTAMSASAMTMKTQAWEALGSVQFDKTALEGAIAKMGSAEYDNPAVQALVGHAAPTILDWAQNAPNSAMAGLSVNTYGKDLMGAAKQGDAAAVESLGNLMGIAWRNAHQYPISADEKAALEYYGIYQDYSKVPAAEAAYQEGNTGGGAEAV